MLPPQVERVAVIGAGASGLAALRIFSQHPRVRVLVAYERADFVGGIWKLRDTTGPMYNSLRTNLPKEIMKFPDSDFSADNPASYVHHSQVLNYLQSYAEKWDLYKYIKLNSPVYKVEPLEPINPHSGWRIIYGRHPKDTSSEVKAGQGYNVAASLDSCQEMTEFDAVVVCNGHFEVPRIPTIPGRELFQGVVLHSLEYREPSPFVRKVVFVLGAGASGVDIALELSSVATKVLFSHNKPSPLASPFPANLHQVPGLSHFTGPADLALLDGSNHSSVDAVLLCTGYSFCMDFLSPTCRPRMEADGHMEPIYRHILHAEWPRLGFIGICSIHIPFPIFYMQAKAICALIIDHVAPSTAAMLADISVHRASLLSRQLPLSRWHVLADQQWSYVRNLAAMSHCSPLSHCLETIYNHAQRERNSQFLRFRETRFRVLDAEEGTYEAEGCINGATNQSAEPD